MFELSSGPIIRIFCNNKFLFQVYYSVVQSISFLFTGREVGGGWGGGGGYFFLLTLCKNIFSDKSVCSIFFF